MSEQKPWRFEDAWILASLDPSLVTTIAAADFFNHAIVTVDEVRDALGRLVGSGLAEPRLSWFSRTAAGNALVGDLQNDFALRSLLARLSKVPLITTSVVVDAEVFDRGVRDYLRPWTPSRLWRRMSASH